jgi:hypothetical protein
LTPSVALVPSGESPDGTGGSPLLPLIEFADTLSLTLFGLQALKVQAETDEQGNLKLTKNIRPTVG